MKCVSMQQGYLFLIGGAEDRRGDKKVLKYLVDKIDPRNVIIVPTASRYPRDIQQCYTDAFKSLGVREIRTLDIRYRDEADRWPNAAAVDEADLIYFGGGDQAKLVATLKPTALFKRIKSRFESGSLHIAGTSAGASALGHPIFYNGDRKGYQKGSIQISEGFGLLQGIAVDTHFSTRNRLPRLCQMLISGHCSKGIGLDEDTGMLVHPNQHGEVFGSGMVTVANSAHVTGSNYSKAAKGEKVHFNNMRIGVLPPGIRFSLRKWSILRRFSSEPHHGVPAMNACCS